MIMRGFLLLSLLLAVTISLSHATTMTITPLGKKTVTNGDILNIQISSEQQFDWGRLELKNIGDIFYILEITKITDAIAEAKVLVVPPQNPKYDGTIEINEQKHKVNVVGFETKWADQKPLQEYLTVMTQHQLSKSYIFATLIGILLLLIGAYFFKSRLKRYLIKRRKLQQIRAEQNDLMNTINTAKTREQLENVYLLKSNIKKLYSVNNGSFNRFVKQMNAIQYRPEWTDEELSLAKQSLINMKNDLEEKRGV
jgi:hypothetical protein